MKHHIELEIIQWMQPLWMLCFRELKINLAVSGIFRIFV